MGPFLPNEILAQIFTLLPSRFSLVVAALVCIRWRDAAIPLLWTDIHIAIDASSPQFTDAKTFRKFLRMNVANGEYIKTLSLNFNLPPPPKDLPDPKTLASYLTAIQAVYSAAVNLHVVRICLPQSLFYDIFPVSSYCLDSENQKVDPYMMELNNHSDIRQRIGQDSYTWKKARTAWIMAKSIIRLIKDIFKDKRQFQVRLDLGIYLVYPPIIKPLPTDEISRRCHELLDLNRELLSNVSSITKLSIDLDQGTAIRDFYGIFDLRLIQTRNLAITLGAIQQRPRIPTMTPQHCPDFWRCLQLPLDSLTLTLNPVSPVNSPTSFPTTLCYLRLGIFKFIPQQPGFETLIFVLSTLPHLERFYFWEEEGIPSEIPFTATVIATKLKYLAIQTINPIPNDLWKATGDSCPLLKTIQFPRNKYLSSNDVKAVSHLSLDSASFIAPPDQWHAWWDDVDHEPIITACREFRSTTRVDMDCAAFFSIASTKRELNLLAKQNWEHDEIWVKSHQLSNHDDKDLDWSNLDWHMIRVGDWYEDIITAEKHNYFPNSRIQENIIVGGFL